MCTVFPTIKQNHPHAIHPNETVGVVPACPPERPRSGVSIPRTHTLCTGIERWMRPYRATRAGTQAPPLPIPVIFFHTIPHKQNNHLRAIRPNETVGAVPVCPPERPRSGVSILKIHALCAGIERRMRPCRATRAGTQAPPLPISVIHPRTILPNDIKHPNETRKQSTQHIGGGNASRTPTPIT